MKKPRSSGNARGSSSSGPSRRLSITRNGTARRLVALQPGAARRRDVAARAQHVLHQQLRTGPNRRLHYVSVVGAVWLHEASGARPGDAAEHPERRPVRVPRLPPAALVVEGHDAALDDAEILRAKGGDPVARPADRHAKGLAGQHHALAGPAYGAQRLEVDLVERARSVAAPEHRALQPDRQ